MHRLFLVIILLLVPFANSAEAVQRVLVLQGVRVAPYDEAYRGIKGVLGGVSLKKLVLSDLEGIDIAKMIRDERPDVILAIGTEALLRLKRIKDTPIIYLMVLDQHNGLTSGSNITGISMVIPPERQLASLEGAVPRIKRVGLLYNPAHTGALARRAVAAARGLGIELVSHEVHSSRDVLPLVKNMKGEIDAFWMLPDVTVVTPETIEYLLLFSLNNRIPVLTFSDKYVEMGALMALDIEPVDLGRQAAELARKVLAGIPVDTIPRSDPRGAVLTVNLKIARKLGIPLREEALVRARLIR